MIFIVVHKDQFLFLCFHQISAGKHTHIVLVFIENREIPMPYIGYGLSYLIHVIIQIKMNDSFFVIKCLIGILWVDQTAAVNVSYGVLIRTTSRSFAASITS